jgi:hypothetical protein
VNDVFCWRQEPFTAEIAENAEVRILKKLRVLGDLGGERLLAAEPR